eukprot:403358089
MEARISHNQTNQYVLENDVQNAQVDQLNSGPYVEDINGKTLNSISEPQNKAVQQQQQKRVSPLSQSEVIERNADSLDNVKESAQINRNNSKDQDNQEEFKHQSAIDQRSLEPLEFDEKAVKNSKPQQKKQDGSLLDLFNSEFFNIHMLMGYLFRKDSEGIIDTLINKLYSEDLSNIDFYIPQLCYMILTKTDGVQRLEKFVLDTSVKHRNIGLKALQYFQSYSEDVQALYQDKSMDFYSTIEQTLVNGDIPQRYILNKTIPLKRFEDYCDKKHKADYLTLQVKFVDQLKYLSTKLKTLNPQDRTLYLKKRLSEINEWINTDVRSQLKDITTESKYSYQGVILPFYEGDDEDPFVIMNILPELAQPFNTKMRAPFKVVFETRAGLQDFNQDLQNQLQSISQDQLELDITDQNQETQLGVTIEDFDDNNGDNPFQIDGTNINQKFEPNYDSDQIQQNNIFQPDKPVDFNGFDKFAKFVEFEEKIFENGKQDDVDFQYKAKDMQLKTAQSQIFKDEDLQDITAKLETISASNSPKNLQMRISGTNTQTFTNQAAQQQSFGSLTKRDLSDPQQLEELIEKFNGGRRSSNVGSLNLQKVDSHSSAKIGKSGASSQQDDWDVISESEVILEGMEDPFKDRWRQIQSKFFEQSNLKSYHTYRLQPMIVKANDDLRQEVLAIQLMKRLQRIFDEAGLNIYLRPYEIFINSSNSGIIEFIPDTCSIDALKKKFPKTKVNGKFWNLRTFFEKYYINNFEEAQKHFVESLAGYSLFNYLFNVKDRHNGNIMLDRQGHIVHIDFGFMLQNFPGGVLGFENAPFKMTAEYIELMDGLDSEMFQYFKSLLIRGLFEVRKNLDDLLCTIEILMQDSKMPCFVRPKTLINEIKDRISLKYNTGLNQNQSDFFELVERLIKGSANNWRTNQYDSFQKMTNGIEK